ncbi:MAG: hypothetical protein LBL96_03965 [Clostridiales bacterium]|jgi:hypothetical protein|nr:hypothetical protein [Clostridiales bacterium]
MRKRISEQNTFPNFNLFNEYQKIERYLSDINVVDVKNIWLTGEVYYTCLGTIEALAALKFLTWNLRGTFLSIEEMRCGLGIDKQTLNNKEIKPDKILDYLQFAINCLHRAVEIVEESEGKYIFQNNDYIPALHENIQQLLSVLNARCELEENADGTQEAVVIYNNSLADEVAEKHPDVTRSIYEYRHIDNRGNLQRKGEILCTLAKDIEPHVKTLKDSIYGSLIKDTEFLWNSIGARHNIELDKGNSVFAHMNEEELETWYDKAFELYLLSKYAIPSLDIMREIKKNKAKLNRQFTIHKSKVRE